MALYALGAHRPTVPPQGEFWIAPGAHVIGQVILGKDVGIWFGAVLRGDNEPITIGEGSNVQENVMMHTDPGKPLSIGRGCTIGHHAILHGCTVGDSTLIGMGATILNDVKIGNNCIVGANALVTEGKVFPDFSLIVGSPAKVTRTLDPGMANFLQGSALSYVQRWQRYVRELKRVD
jgi:carbonic anhydrase/acetyltransferase-like protein (isoleucine patch superfamily)